MNQTEIMKQVEEIKLGNGQVLHAVPSEKLHEHKAVKEVYSLAVKLRDEVKNVKKTVEEKINKVLDETASKYGEEWKGNARLFTLDESLKVMVKVHPLIKFDKQMVIAKQKYDQWLQEENASDDLRGFVKKAFRVNAEGNIPKSKLTEIRNYPSQNPRKKEGDEIYDKAKRKEIRKPYISFYEKDAEGNWQRVKVNFSEM